MDYKWPSCCQQNSLNTVSDTMFSEPEVRTDDPPEHNVSRCVLLGVTRNNCHPDTAFYLWSLHTCGFPMLPSSPRPAGRPTPQFGSGVRINVYWTVASLADRRLERRAGEPRQEPNSLAVAESPALPSLVRVDPE